MHRLQNITCCCTGPFGPLTAHSLLILAVDVRPRTLASDRAAIRLFRRSISCVRAVDVGLLGGPPWSLVDEVGGWWDWSTLKIARQDEEKKKRQIWANIVETILIPTPYRQVSRIGGPRKKTSLFWYYACALQT